MVDCRGIRDEAGRDALRGEPFEENLMSAKEDENLVRAFDQSTPPGCRERRWTIQAQSALEPFNLGMVWLRIGNLAILLAFAIVTSVQPSDALILVNTPDDEDVNDLSCSLREAIVTANI